MSDPTTTDTPQPYEPTIPDRAMVTTAGEWKASALDASPLEVPSGNVCLAKNPGMRSFMKSGIIPNPLMAPLQKALDRGSGLQDKELKALMQDSPEHIEAMAQLVDNVVVEVVVQPRVWAVPTMEEISFNLKNYPEDELDESGRLKNRLYVDEVDFQDKAFIFQWSVGGTRDLETFRAEYRASLGDLSGEPVQRASSKRAARPAATKRTNSPAKPRAKRG